MLNGNMNNQVDCYYFFYSSCTKGDECSFRHCQEALGTETVCTNWKRGLCLRSNCKFRHMEKSKVDRANTKCFWEDQPCGCMKPHCVFYHTKPRTRIPQANEKQGLILPISGKISPVPSTTSNSKIESSPILNVSRNDNISMDEADEGIHSPVEPFVVSFDENEESDSESVTSTPVKLSEKKVPNSNLEKTNLLSKFPEKATEKPFNFKVKSLEEIRLAKIHKESENIYKTDYTVPSLEDYKVKRLTLDTVPSIEVQSMDMVSLQPENVLDDAVITENIETTQCSLKKDNDLRARLTHAKKKYVPVNETQASLNFKVKSLAEIKVKSLAEIREEKKLKQAASIQENGTNLAITDGILPVSTTIRPPVTTVSSNPLRKLKIHRKGITSAAKEDLINIGKRKNINAEVGSVKIMKMNSASKDKFELNKIQQKQEFQKQPVESLLPFLKRKPGASSLSPGITTSDSHSVDVVADSSEKYPAKKEIHSDKTTLNNIINSTITTVEVEADSNNTSEMDSNAESISPQSKNLSPDSTKTFSVDTVNRSISIDEIDHYLKDTDVDMDDLDETGDGGEDDIMLKINEFLDS